MAFALKMSSDSLAFRVATETNSQKKEWIRTTGCYVQHKILVIILQHLLHKLFKFVRVFVQLF
jgi:hypothetical protein